jgi:hypothetical protein
MLKNLFFWTPTCKSTINPPHKASLIYLLCSIRSVCPHTSIASIRYSERIDINIVKMVSHTIETQKASLHSSESEAASPSTPSCKTKVLMPDFSVIFQFQMSSWMKRGNYCQTWARTTHALHCISRHVFLMLASCTRT